MTLKIYQKNNMIVFDNATTQYLLTPSQCWYTLTSIGFIFKNKTLQVLFAGREFAFDEIEDEIATTFASNGDVRDYLSTLFIGSTSTRPMLAAYPPSSQQTFAGNTLPSIIGGVTFTADRIYYIPMQLEAAATFKSIYHRVSSPVVTSVGDFVVGIYAINDTYTGELLFQTTVGNTNVTAQTILNADFTLEAGYYILAWNASGNMSCSSRNTGLALFGHNAMNDIYRYCYVALTYNAVMPATMSLTGVTFVNVGNTPHVAFNLIP